MTERDAGQSTPDDDLLRQEERAAAAEASHIGGPAPDYEGSEEERPLEEGGEGEAEGFEQAERELEEQASHGDPKFDPEVDAFTPEEDSDRSTAAYGEADEVDPTEVVRDPGEGEDDPGTGPGVAADR
jgi:hypothetical protein